MTAEEKMKCNWIPRKISESSIGWRTRTYAFRKADARKIKYSSYG